MTGSPGTTSNPALSALGDRLESAASTAVASGGVPPSGRAWTKLALVPIVALFVVAGLVIASLVPGGSGDTAEAAIVSAARQTSERATGRFEVTVAADGMLGAGGEPLTLTTTGAYDADQGLYTASLDTSQVLGALPGGEAVGEIGPTIDAVVAGEIVYLDVSPLASVLGAEWLKVTVPELAGEDGLSSLVDPGAVLDALEGAGADMSEVGREDVRGVETTHYSGTLSLQEAYDAIPADDRSELEGMLGGVVDLTGLPDLPTDVWVDDDGLVRRIELSVDAASFGVPGLDDAGSITLTVELFDIGEDVAIEVPADDEAIAIDELTPEGLLDGLGGMLEGVEGLEDLDLDSLLGELEGLDLDAMLEELEAMAGELDLGSMMDELEDYLGDTLPDPTAPPGETGPDAEPVPGAPSTTVTA
jgi:hypothetical protein